MRPRSFAHCQRLSRAEDTMRMANVRSAVTSFASQREIPWVIIKVQSSDVYYVPIQPIGDSCISQCESASFCGLCPAPESIQKLLELESNLLPASRLSSFTLSQHLQRRAHLLSPMSVIDLFFASLFSPFMLANVAHTTCNCSAHLGERSVQQLQDILISTAASVLVE